MTRRMRILVRKLESVVGIIHGSIDDGNAANGLAAIDVARDAIAEFLSDEIRLVAALHAGGFKCSCRRNEVPRES